ncbi:MAG TPA: DNA primase [Candidatus Limnocylindria bacterium]|nr:DNA primase [Candidatus Limnocylindria bacterium]
MPSRFPTAWVDAVYAASDIVDLVSRYLPLTRKGRRHWGLCPFHTEKTPSFSVNGELNLYHCFGCKASGNVAQFVMEMEKLTYPEALLHLAQLYRVPPPPTADLDPEEERRRSLRERLIEATRDAAKFYHELLWTDAGAKALAYLHGRGLDDAVIRRFGIGASPDDWDALLTHLTGKGYTVQELEQAALVTVRESSRYDVFRDRAMFPIISRFGQPIGFGARALGDAQPKYLNTSDSLIYSKRATLYGLNLLKKSRGLDNLLLVEGYMDVVALSQHGVANAVATLGTSLTPEQARLMKHYAPEAVICYDGDEAGQSATMRALDVFQGEGIPARVLSIPGSKDPDEFVRAFGAEAFRALKPQAATSFRLSRMEAGFDLSSEEGRREYAKQACRLISTLKEPVEADYYLGKIQLKTGIAKEVLAAQAGVARQRTEPAPAAEKPARGAKRQEDAVSSPEFTLAALLALRKLPPNFVAESDFEDAAVRRIAAGLLAGKTPAAVMEDAQSEEDRLLAGEIFNRLPDLDPEAAIVAAEDCLRKIRAGKLNRRIEQLYNEVKTQEGEGKRLTLELIRVLQLEHSKQSQ